jgi:hypothetical protein
MHVITTQKELETVLAAFEKSDFVTVDTEFIRETTFWPILCLIQMAAPGVTALIDPLSPDIDLKPFFRLMANEAVVKVFHAARQDIEIIVHLGDLVPHPVFDTQVAAMVCGFGDSVSYDQLVQRITGARLDKSSRFTDWRHRPLSDKQLDYALADVTHLIEVYQHLSAELERENRAHWLNEEMDVLTSRETYDPHPEDAWKRLKMRLRKPQELAIVQTVGGRARRGGAPARRPPRPRAQGRCDLRSGAAGTTRRGGPCQAAHHAKGLGALLDGDGPAWGDQYRAGLAQGGDAETAEEFSAAGRLERRGRTVESAAADRRRKTGRGLESAGLQRRHRPHRGRGRGCRCAGAARLAARRVRRSGTEAGARRDRHQVRQAQDSGV